MPGSWPPTDFPHLTDVDYKSEMSDATRRYNCIAWATGDIKNWWWPDPFNIGKWPRGVPREVTLMAFIRAFAELGYMPCQDGTLEDGVEKVALYAKREADGSLRPTHAAIQLPNGNWSSKLGEFEDIEHFTLAAVNGPRYGAVCQYVRRHRRN